MKVNMIKINNFKSIGEKDNILTIDKLNVIIGKNESGKSNIIEALSKIDITGINDSSFFKNMNKINRKYPTFELELEPYSYELKKYSHLTKMHIFIKSQFDIEFDGGYEYYINNDKDFVKVKKRIFEILEENPVPFQKKENIDNLKTFLNSIKNADSKVFLYLTYMDDLLNAMQRVTYDYKEELIEKFRFCIKFLMKFHELFPTFFAIDDFQLNSSYPKEQIISDKNINMLKNLLDVAEIPVDLILEYWNAQDVSTRMQIEKEINELLKINITCKFNNFYTQESISFEARYEDDSIKFLLSTTDTYLSYYERSDGLKWYFNLFLKMQSANLSYHNVIYIMDEPGVKLHVNAQKKLIDLFEELSNKDNQIIYTTHSPYMIDQDNLCYVRPITKDEKGYSHIFNKYNHIPESNKSKIDTLTPIFDIIGLDCKYNLGPSFQKINIVVEGVSDANYLHSYFYQKKVSKKDIPNIIPSIGVSNIDKIVSILIGWGCKYFILLDNDQQGRDEYLVLTQKLCISKKYICFTDGTNIYNTQINHCIENVFSEEDYNLYINKPDYNDFKNNYSKKFMYSVKEKKIKMSMETLENFEKIINQVDVIR